MTFLSLTWLFWMWITVSLYWLVPGRWRQLFLAGLTLVFVASVSPLSAVILLAFVTICHLAVNLNEPGLPLVGVAITLIVTTIVIFRLGVATDPTSLVETTVIPLGLSFYAFRCIHFVLERYKHSLSRVTLVQLAGYLLFLPTIVIGPIHRFDEYQRDLKRQRFDPTFLSEGAERILFGYAKIVILSNYFVEGQFGDFIRSFSDQSAPFVLYLGVVQKGLNLYLQFSGYSDIAIGFALLLGYRVMENFDWPYLKPNISAFWQSWHISLSQWCRDYVYGPVVAMTRKPALGALATMIVIGLWHEISLRFLLWGLYHGVGIVCWQQFQNLRQTYQPALPRGLAAVAQIASSLLTVHFVWFSLVILMAEGPLEALELYKGILLWWI